MRAKILDTDDLGCPVRLRHPARRIVSLVPSLTESIASVDPGTIVGATDYCTHPVDLVATRVRGTKNPDIRAIVALGPDLVIANREENRRIDVERLRAAGIQVWVTEIETVADALTSLRRLFETALGWKQPAWLTIAATGWEADAGPSRASVAIPIWRDPWMVVGSRTFADDMARILGLANIFRDEIDRYPRITVEEIRRRNPEVVLLPDEPYSFTSNDGPECFPDSKVVLLEGRLLTWYGPSLATARTAITAALAQ